MPRQTDDNGKFELKEVSWKTELAQWTFQSLAPFSAASIKNSTFLIAVSLRNPLFSNKWLKEVVEGVYHFNGKAVLCLVDTPYISSVQTLSQSRSDLVKGLTSLREERREHLRRLEKVSAEHHDRINLVDWGDLAAITPNEHKTELLSAFSVDGRARKYILKQVMRAYPEHSNQETLMLLGRFFIEEAPVLCNLYYSLIKGCIDIYPGQQADFFWALENQRLKDELPLLSDMAANGPSHRYAIVRWSSHEHAI